MENASYTTEQAIEILAGKTIESRTEFVKLFSDNPLVYNKDEDEYSQSLENEFINRLKNKLLLIHTSEIKPPAAFDASWNQYKGDVGILSLDIWFDLKNATMPEGTLRGQYNKYFTGCIKKDSLKTFSDRNHFYIGFNKPCTKITVTNSYLLHKYVVESGYKYQKVDGVDLVIMNDIPRGEIWNFINVE